MFQDGSNEAVSPTMNGTRRRPNPRPDREARRFLERTPPRACDEPSPPARLSKKTIPLPPSETFCVNDIRPRTYKSPPTPRTTRAKHLEPGPFRNAAISRWYEIERKAPYPDDDAPPRSLACYDATKARRRRRECRPPMLPTPVNGFVRFPFNDFKFF